MPDISVQGSLFLHSIGLEVTDDNLEQLAVFCQALSLYQERTAAYGQAWKNYGALANVLKAATKMDRIMESWWHGTGPPAMHKDNLDDAFDLLNFTTFFIRCAVVGNLTGSPPERPDLVELYGDDGVVRRLKT